MFIKASMFTQVDFIKRIETIDLYQEVYVYQEVRRCLLRVDVYDCLKGADFTKRSTQRSTFIIARGGASTGAISAVQLKPLK